MPRTKDLLTAKGKQLLRMHRDWHGEELTPAQFKTGVLENDASNLKGICLFCDEWRLLCGGAFCLGGVAGATVEERL